MSNREHRRRKDAANSRWKTSIKAGQPDWSQLAELLQLCNSYSEKLWLRRETGLMFAQLSAMATWKVGDPVPTDVAAFFNKPVAPQFHQMTPLAASQEHRKAMSWSIRCCDREVERHRSQLGVQLLTKNVMCCEHHGTIPPLNFFVMKATNFKRLVEQINGTAPREYPAGRMGENDDGSLSYAIAFDKKSQSVVMRFGRPVEWIGLGRKAARELRDALDAQILSHPQLKGKLTGDVVAKKTGFKSVKQVKSANVVVDHVPELVEAVYSGAEPLCMVAAVPSKLPKATQEKLAVAAPEAMRNTRRKPLRKRILPLPRPPWK